jgi:hypothetical protein
MAWGAVDVMYVGCHRPNPWHGVLNFDTFPWAMINVYVGAGATAYRCIPLCLPPVLSPWLWSLCIDSLRPFVRLVLGGWMYLRQLHNR